MRTIKDIADLVITACKQINVDTPRTQDEANENMSELCVRVAIMAYNLALQDAVNESYIDAIGPELIKDSILKLMIR